MVKLVDFKIVSWEKKPEDFVLRHVENAKSLFNKDNFHLEQAENPLYVRVGTIPGLFVFHGMTTLLNIQLKFVFDVIDASSINDAVAQAQREAQLGFLREFREREFEEHWQRFLPEIPV